MQLCTCNVLAQHLRTCVEITSGTFVTRKTEDNLHRAKSFGFVSSFYEAIKTVNDS